VIAFLTPLMRTGGMGGGGVMEPQGPGLGAALSLVLNSAL